MSMDKFMGIGMVGNDFWLQLESTTALEGQFMGQQQEAHNLCGAVNLERFSTEKVSRIYDDRRHLHAINVRDTTRATHS